MAKNHNRPEGWQRFLAQTVVNIKMKSTIIILGLLTSTVVYSQEQTVSTISVEYDLTYYKTFIKSQLETLAQEIDLKWVYHKPVVVKLKSHESAIPPPPPILYSFKSVDFEFDEKDNFAVNIVEDSEIFDFTDKKKIKENYKIREEKYGKGVLFSIPYKWENEETIFIDYQIINWDYLCGNGTYQTIEYK